MSKSLIFTLDLEDHRPNPASPRRYSDVTRKILDFLDRREIRASVFVLGRVARESPALIREIAARGHEIGFHSSAHKHLVHETKTSLERQLVEYKAYLEDLIGAPVIGYRAPAFSLTPDSVWATDVIAAAGYEYSSSVMPAKSPIFGFPGVPRQPFRWPNGLLEIPSPVARIGPSTLPFLGGFYLRYLPKFLIARGLRRGDDRQCYWTYCHPHDFDHGEPFYRIAGTSTTTSLLLWFNRKRTFKKFASVLNLPEARTPGRPFAELIEAGEFADVPTYGGQEPVDRIRPS